MHYLLFVYVVLKYKFKNNITKVYMETNLLDCIS